MNKEKRGNIIIGSCVAAVIIETLLAKAFLFPERSFFDLLIGGFFAHIIICAVVGFVMDKVLPQAATEQSDQSGNANDGCGLDETPGADEESAQSDDAEEDALYDDQFEEWLQEEEEKKRIQKQERQSQKKILRYVFSMMAKVAKADGKVVREEVEAAQRVFGVYEFAEAFHDFCVNVFNAAKDNSQSVYWYAEKLAEMGGSQEWRLFVYELLWDVACADGVLAKDEKEILKVICGYLKIPYRNYKRNYDKRILRGYVDDAEFMKQDNAEMTIEEAYKILECSTDSSNAEVKDSYRNAAKRYHPDILRAANVPEDLIAIASAKMAKLNDAWEIIRKARGMQ